MELNTIMIKLIATDMDGTLLDENGKLPKDFFNILEQLNNKNVKFIVASGRPYPTLYEDFKPISDELYYICDNGAYIVEKNNPPKVSIINKELLHDFLISLEKIEDIQVLLCGLKGAYHLPLKGEELEEINKYYINKIEVDNLFNIDDDIFKITICDFKGSANNSYKILHPIYKDKLMVVVSGDVWLDIMNLGVNKGAALEEIQNLDNITYEETMAFGDYNNDLEMLDKAYYSFAMENSNNDIKERANFIAESNTKNGVMKAIKKYVL